MLDTVEKPNLQDSIGLAQLVAVAIMLAGLVFVVMTGNARASLLFSLVGCVLMNVDFYVKKQIAPEPTLSLFNVSEKPKTKIRYGPLLWFAFGVMLVACVFIGHPRIYASLMIAGFGVLLYNRYQSARS